MPTDNPIKALEELNERYLEISQYESPEYVLGRRILHFKESFPLHTIRWIRNYLKSRKVQKENDRLSHFVSADDFFYASPSPEEEKKGVVYSCITNGYDKPKEPILTSDALDFVLYTDLPKDNESVWEYREIVEVNNVQGSNYANRFYKFNPFNLFPDYDYSIYIDGNVQVVSDVTGLYSVAHKSPLGIAMHRHFARNCAYKDAEWCEINKRGNLPALRNQVIQYREEGFPEEFGLCEATIIVVDLHNQIAKKVMDTWWKEFCRAGSGRDQISFPYVLWKIGYKIMDVGCLGNDEYRNPKFIIGAHKGKLV